MTSVAQPTHSPRRASGALPLLLAPAVLFGIAFFVVPMAGIIGSAFSTGQDNDQHFSLSNYVDIVTDGFYWEVLFRTIRISILTTLATLALSYPAALTLFFMTGRARQVFLFIAISPLFVSVIVRTYGWVVILSPNGLLNAMLPDELSLHLLQTEPGIVIGLTHIYVPFMLLSLNASLTKIDRRVLAAAASLGASAMRMFRDIIIPLTVPGILAGTTIVFTIAMTSFSTPILLGGSRSKTMPYLIYQQVMLASDWNLGSALALFFLVATLLCVAVLSVLTRRLTRYGVA